ncbi:cytochrome P450 [Myxococcota bacterium]|nr:cytochrome P450 [Myxococcota bacterium]
MKYDPYAREMQHDPYPSYAWFRDNQPCSYNPDMDFYALFRFEDVWQATLDWQTHSSSLGPQIENRGETPGDVFSIIGMDPPRHTRLRNIVSRGFTPRRIEAMEPEIRSIARSLLDALEGQKAFDIQQEFSVRFPMDVICVLLGIPEEDRDTYRGWVDAGLSRDPDTGLPPEEGLAWQAKSRDYILGLLEERRKNPRDDLITLIADAEYEEPDGARRKLDDFEVTAFTTLLAAAGAETTAKLIGNAVVYLHENPDQRQLLWDEPKRIDNAIEELLRYDAPSQFQGRVALSDTKLHGVTIPAGARVALVTGAACRDEREFEDPERFDVTRTHEREIYFGHGQHVCIGKSLARLETRIALEEFGARFPDYQVNRKGLTRTYQAHVRGFANIPLET